MLSLNWRVLSGIEGNCGLRLETPFDKSRDGSARGVAHATDAKDKLEQNASTRDQTIRSGYSALMSESECLQLHMQRVVDSYCRLRRSS